MKSKAKKSIMLSLAIFGFSTQGFALDCSLKKVQEMVLSFHQINNQTETNIQLNFPYKVVEARPFKLLPNLILCEAVLSVAVEDNQKKEFVSPKAVVYVNPDIFITGDIRIKDNNRVKMISYERFNEINKEFFEDMKKKQEEWQKEILKQQEKLEKRKQESLLERISKINLEKIEDINIGNGDTEFLVFIDIMCPYCKKVVEFLDNELSKGKSLKTRYVLVGILGSTSINRAISVLCKYKDSINRLKAIKNREDIGKFDCIEGKEKLLANNEIFKQTGSSGVPLIVVYKNGKIIDAIMGADIERIKNYINDKDLRK